MKGSVYRKHQFLPNINKFLVFDVIRKNSLISASELVRSTNLSMPTIIKILRDLEDSNYIKKDGKGESRGGRRPDLYRFNRDARYIIGVDFEIPKVRIISADLADRLIARKSYTFNINDELTTITDRLKSEIKEIISKSNTESKKDLIGIGIAISGFTDPKKGISLSTPRIPFWKNVPICRIIKEEFNVPVHLINNTDARMMAEVEFAIKELANNLIYVAFNEGLGAGLVVNGELISGRYGNAGAISHTTVNPKGPRCICGNSGCLELYASERGVLTRVKELLGKEENPDLSPQKIDFKKVIALYKQGNRICTTVLEDAAYYMGIGIANVVNLLEVDRVIVGGSIVQAGKPFLNMLKKEIKSHLQGVLKSNLKIQFAKLKEEEAGAIGAMVPIISDFFKEPELKIKSQRIRITNTHIITNR
ncbi:MAG: ROK family protein [Spirochaetota bacterium]